MRSQASDDPAHDLLMQAEAVEADVLLLAPGDPSAAAVLAGADCTVILGSAGYSDGPVSVRPGPGDDGLAAIEQALRIALRHNAPLVLVESGDKKNDKRAEDLIPRLRSIGLTVTSGPATGLVVAGRGATGEAQLVVRGRQQDKGESLFRLVDELTAAPA